MCMYMWILHASAGHTPQAKQLTIQPMHSSMRGQRIPPTPYLTSTDIDARTPRVPGTWRCCTTHLSPTTLHCTPHHTTPLVTLSNITHYPHLTSSKKKRGNQPIHGLHIYQ